MATAVERVIATAQAEVGYYEKASNSQLDSKSANRGRNNYTKYARDLDALGIYNGPKNGYYWCDVFVDWLFIKTFGVAAGLKMINQTKGDCGAGCTFSAQYYENMGRLFYSDPQPGDQIFFGNRSNGDYYHTGIVYKVANSCVYTIEGNTSANDGVNGNGDGVSKKCYNLSYSEIGAYGRPNWSLAPAETKEEDDMTEAQVRKIAQEEFHKVEPTYNTLEQVPIWWRTEIEHLIKIGLIKGTGGGKLGLTYTRAWTGVLIYRAMKVIADEDPIYHTIDDIPEWGKPAVQALIDSGKLSGEKIEADGTRILNLPRSDVRMIVALLSNYIEDTSSEGDPTSDEDREE